MERVPLWKLATVFSKVGLFTLGGGYAMIPLIDREVVQKRKWMESDEFYDILAIAQSSPGLLAVNISIFAGYRMRGRIGSVAAAKAHTAQITTATAGNLCVNAPFVCALSLLLRITPATDATSFAKRIVSIASAVKEKIPLKRSPKNTFCPMILDP